MPAGDTSQFILSKWCRTYSVWLIIPILLFLALMWLFLAPLQLQIDTRTPQVYLRWFTVGEAKLIFKEEKWWLKISFLFFSKTWDLGELSHRKKKVRKFKTRKSTKNSKWLRRLFNMGKSFRVTRWQIAIDTGDAIKNAWLYHLNFYPRFSHHLYINFFDENYLFLEIRNAPWKMMYALMK